MPRPHARVRAFAITAIEYYRTPLAVLSYCGIPVGGVEGELANVKAKEVPAVNVLNVDRDRALRGIGQPGIERLRE